MGRMLGAFDQDESFDRPDLNKCPNCGSFFAQDACPICGMVCPEEMRAGNRKPVKKRRRKSNPSAGRVTFIEWYYSWWFIILMMFFMPIVGIILLLSSPHKKSLKITLVVVALLYTVATTYGIGNIISLISGLDAPVDTSLSKEEYLEKCKEVTPESFYRSAKAYDGVFVSMTLTVVEKTMDADGVYYDEDYSIYYICRDTEGGEFKLLVRDCQQSGNLNLIDGDVITVYGEGAGDVVIYDREYEPYEAPCVNAAYVVLKK